jgi:hypothetical protein
MKKLAIWLRYVAELVGPLMRRPRYINTHSYNRMDRVRKGYAGRLRRQ